MSAPAVAVLGAGAWGTALAAILARDDTPVLLWAREQEVARDIAEHQENRRFLPGHRLSDAILATGRLDELASCPVWMVAAPAQHLGALLAEAPRASRPTLVLCAKGIEQQTARLMPEVAVVAAPGCPVALLSGPSFAKDAARGLPTAVTLACEDMACGEALAHDLARPGFRLYWTDDLKGTAVGGAVKNVLAIACGVAIGAGLGESARAALVARGFAEMVRLGAALGGRAETLAGLSGLGDLVLTCGSPQSRNMALGVALGEGQSVARALASSRGVAEGALTAPVLARLARERGVDMPIGFMVEALVAGRVAAADAIAELLARPLRSEGIALVT